MDLDATRRKREEIKRAAFDKFKESIINQLEQKINATIKEDLSDVHVEKESTNAQSKNVKNENPSIAIKHESKGSQLAEFDDVEDSAENSSTEDEGDDSDDSYSPTDEDHVSKFQVTKQSELRVDSVFSTAKCSSVAWESDGAAKHSTGDVEMLGAPVAKERSNRSNIQGIDDTNRDPVDYQSTAKRFKPDEVYEILDDDSSDQDVVCVPPPPFSPAPEELKFNFHSSSEAEDSSDAPYSIVQSGPSNLILGSSGLNGYFEQAARLSKTAGVEMLGLPQKQLVRTPGEYTWSKFEMPKVEIPFTQFESLKVPMDPNASAIEFFDLVVNAEFYQIFIHQAEACATEMMKDNISPRSLISQWKRLNVRELRTWIGLLILMGKTQCTSFLPYWSTGTLFHNPMFGKSMKKDRWMGIMQALHFVKTPGINDSQPSDPVFKINPLINWFNNRMTTIYSANQHLCINDPVVLWQGRILPLKCVRDKSKGIKLDMLTDRGGMILRFSADKRQSLTLPEAQKVVLTLLKDHLGKGHSVCVDETYNSIELSHELLFQRTYVTGALNSKETVPKCLDDPGRQFYCYSNHGVCLIKCKENDKDVTYVSSEFGPQIAEITVNKTRVFKPLAVAEYDKYMSAIDKQYQLLAEYNTVHKLTKNHVRLSVHIIHMAVYNAYLLYKKYGANKLDYLGFRNELSTSLIMWGPR